MSPYVLGRMSGTGQQALLNLRLGRSMEFCRELRALDLWLRDNRERICDEVMYGMIGRADGATKSLMVAIRRRVYNRKMPRMQDLRVVASDGCNRSRRAVLNYCAKLRRYLGMIESARDGDARELFDAELLLKRVDLVDMLSDPEFIKALQVASPSMASSVLKLVCKHPREWRKKERQVEVRAVRYLTRMVVKTSPFGRFGPVVLGEFDPGYTGVIASDFSRSRVRTQSSLNLSFVDRIISALWRDAQLARDLPLHLNDTYFVDAGDLCFFQPYEKNGIPKYTSLRRGRLLPEIQVVIDEAKAAAGQVTTAQLVERLANGELGTRWDVQRIGQFVESLVNSGLLIRQMRVPTAEVERIGNLLEQAGTHSVDVPGDWREDLETLRRYGAEFSRQSVRGRNRLIQSSGALVEKLLQETYSLKDKMSRDRRLFVEDTYFEEAELKLGQQFWEPIREDVSAFLDAVFRRDSGGLAHQMLKDTFIQRYGEGGRCSDLQKFASELSKTAFSEATGSSEFRNSGPVNENGLAYLRALVEEAARAGDGHECALDSGFFRAMAEGFPEGPKGRKSIALHLQFVAASMDDLQDGNFDVVLNYTLPGHGRFFTRYCDMFDPERAENGLVERIKKQIDALSESLEGTEVMELVSVANHNAQVHPPLTPRMLVLPGETAESHPAQQLLPRDLELRHETGDNSLQFYHDERRVVPMYMGFFHAMALPYSHRIFVDGNPHSYHAERNRLAEFQENMMPFLGTEEERGKVRHYARLRCGRLILQRETWSLDIDLVPEALLATVDDFELFMQANLWRMELGLPSTSFVRVKRRKSSPSDIYSQLSANEHKPMFLDFENFFTLRSFFATLATVDVQSVQFEEMLPGFNDTPLHVNGSPVTMEVQIELNRD